MHASESLSNAAMMAAGYPVLADASAYACDIAAAKQQFRQVLAAHDPFPAFIFSVDRHVVDMNCGTQRLMQRLMPEYWQANLRTGSSMDMLDAATNPEGFLSKVRGQAAHAASLVALLRTEEWLRPELGPRITAFENAVILRYGALSPPAVGCEAAVPLGTLTFDDASGPLTFVGVQSLLGPPHDVRPTSVRLVL